MNKKRTVILSGAGAAIPWGAPSTDEITKKLCTDSTFRSISNQPLGAWFLDKLRHDYHLDPRSVNFETILNCIEMLGGYFSSYLKGPSILYQNMMLPVFFKEKDEIEEVLAFNRIYEMSNIDGWQSKNERVKFYGFWQDYDTFFEQVHDLFVKLISGEIEKYEHRCLDNEFSVINNGLREMILTFSDNQILRAYTLNYDRLFQVAGNINYFEGFSKNVVKESTFDSKKVFNDQDNNIHYNLHGSIHYDKFKIIAGLNKSTRILENPYSQFYHAFYRDCFNADIIIIIGYSFSDVHINRAIKEGSIANKNQKILCVGYDKLDSELNFDKQGEYDLFLSIDRYFSKFLGQHHCVNKVADKENAERLFYFRKGFENFLVWKIWDKVF